MRRFLTLILISFLYSSCSSPIEKADNYFQENYDKKFNDEFKVLAETSVYFYYSNPINYWYPEEYTAKDILYDEFKQGYRKIKMLEDRTINLPNHPEDLYSAKIQLLEAIEKAKKEIKEKQRAIEDANSLYGLATFGGVEGLYALSSMFSTAEEREKAEKKDRQMPENVSIAFENLLQIIINQYALTSKKMAELESEALAEITTNEEQIKTIRANYKRFIRNKFYNNFKEEDTIARNEMVEQLFGLFTSQYPVGKYEIENKNVDGFTYDYKVGEKNCYENIVEKNSSGQTVYRFNFKIEADKTVNGIFGYYPEYKADLNWWEGDIQGSLENNKIVGTYTFTSEGMNYIEPFIFVLGKNKATYMLEEEFIYIDGVKKESKQEPIIFDKVVCLENNKG